MNIHLAKNRNPMANPSGVVYHSHITSVDMTNPNFWPTKYAIPKHPANRKMTRSLPTRVKKELRSYLNKKKTVPFSYVDDLERLDFDKGSSIVEQGFGLDGWELGANILRFIQTMGGEPIEEIEYFEANREIQKWLHAYSMVCEALGHSQDLKASVMSFVKRKLSIKGSTLEIPSFMGRSMSKAKKRHFRNKGRLVTAKAKQKDLARNLSKFVVKVV